MNFDPHALDHRWQLLMNQQMLALNVLIQNQLLNPYLSIYYSTIDIYSSIWSGDTKDGDRFKAFCSKYIVKHLPDLTPNDLWNARCAILHGAKSASRLSKTGAARELAYCGSKAQLNDLNDHIIRSPNSSEFVSISIEQLSIALFNGLTEFTEELNSNPQMGQDCLRRFYQTNAFIPASNAPVWQHPRP